jgi:hypothetical protein
MGKQPRRIRNAILAGIVASFVGATGPAVASPLEPPAQRYVIEAGQAMFAQAPDASVLKLGATFTLEAWVFPEIRNDNAVVLGRNSQTGSGGDYTLVFLNDYIAFGERTSQQGSDTTIVGPTLPRNTWSHVAGTLDSGGRLHLYVNGSEIASATSAGPPDPSPSLPFQVGSISVGLGAFALREARVWNRALSSDQIAAVAAAHLAGDENGLIADWPLDDGAGQSARDISPNHLDLQLGTGPQPDLSDDRWARTVILDNGPYYSFQTEHANDLSIECGANPCSLVSAVPIDFNHDGAIDLLAITTGQIGNLFAASPVVALRNDGHGVFTNVTAEVFDGPVTQTVDAGNNGTVVADFNGDGLPDVYIGDGGQDNENRGAQSHLLFTTAAGHFVDATASLPQIKLWTETTTAADFRHAGVSDICTDMSVNSAGTLYDLNDGTGHFSADYSRIPYISNMLANHAVDVNNDGAPDLVFGRDAGGFLPAPPDKIYLNDGTGHFRAAPDSALPPHLFDPSSALTDIIRSADFDGDGWQDLVEIQGHFADATGGYASRVVVLLNTRDGTFRYAPNPIPPDPSGGVTTEIPVDLNGDGKVDIVVERVYPWPRILVNSGGANFVDASEILPLAFPQANSPEVIVDVDGDGRPDLVTLRPNGYVIALNVKNFDAALLGPVQPPRRRAVRH